MKSIVGRGRLCGRVRIRTLLVMLAVLVVGIFFMSRTIEAASSTFNYPGILENRYTVISGLDTYTPDLDSYPFNDKEVRSAAITDLWGDSKSLTKYLGEVPHDLSEDGEGKKLRTYNSTHIDGETRPWSEGSGLKEGDIKPDSSDLHVKALAEASDTGSGSLGWILYHIVRIIDVVVGSLLHLLMLLKDVSMDMILGGLNSGGELKDTVNTLFLISPDGQMSPFLVIMLVVFIFSLVGVIIKAVKGDMAFQLALRELGFLVLAGVIAGVALSPGGQGDIAKWSVNIATTLSNDVVSSGTQDSKLFTYETSNETKDSNMTQMALLDKPFVDNFIRMQFGYSTKQLRIKDEVGNYTKNFGKDTKKAVSDTFPKGQDFAVDTGSGSVHNLGYYWWAANSNVAAEKPINKGGTVQEASNMRVLYIIDFLNNARALAKENGEKAVVAKIDKIMTKMWDPDWMSGSLSMLLLTALKVAMLYSFYLVIVFLSIGKLIISVGSFTIPVLAGLTLVNKTRSIAKTLLKTYVMGFVRYIVGLIIINLIISMVATLASQGTGGILIAIVIAAVIGKFVPNLLLEINRRVAINDAPFMRGVNRTFSKYVSAVKHNRQKSRKDGIEYDKDGNLTKKDRSAAATIGRGISRFRKSGNTNPAGSLSASLSGAKGRNKKLSGSNATDKISIAGDIAGGHGSGKGGPILGAVGTPNEPENKKSSDKRARFRFVNQQDRLSADDLNKEDKISSVLPLVLGGRRFRLASSHSKLSIDTMNKDAAPKISGIGVIGGKRRRFRVVNAHNRSSINNINSVGIKGRKISRGALKGKRLRLVSRHKKSVIDGINNESKLKYKVRPSALSNATQAGTLPSTTGTRAVKVAATGTAAYLAAKSVSGTNKSSQPRGTETRSVPKPVHTGLGTSIRKERAKDTDEADNIANEKDPGTKPSIPDKIENKNLKLRRAVTARTAPKDTDTVVPKNSAKQDKSLSVPSNAVVPKSVKDTTRISKEPFKGHETSGIAANSKDPIPVIKESVSDTANSITQPQAARAVTDNVGDIENPAPAIPATLKDTEDKRSTDHKEITNGELPVASKHTVETPVKERLNIKKKGSETVKRGVKNLSLRAMQKSVTGRKIAEGMYSKSKERTDQGKISKDE